jgi:arginine exporter protein ArgO
MAIRGIAPLCIFCIICIICIISVGIVCVGILGDAAVAGDAAAGGVVPVCWWASCASADVADAIASMAEAQRAAGMEANFMGDSLVAKNMKLSSRTSG